MALWHYYGLPAVFRIISVFNLEKWLNERVFCRNMSLHFTTSVRSSVPLHKQQLYGAMFSWQHPDLVSILCFIASTQALMWASGWWDTHFSRLQRQRVTEWQFLGEYAKNRSTAPVKLQTLPNQNMNSCKTMCSTAGNEQFTNINILPLYSVTNWQD